MELDDLDIFLEAVRRGSLSKTARSLNMSQPTISRRIQRLEADLGHPLLDRRGGSISPTRAGLAVLRFAQSLREQRHVLESELESPPPLSGELNVAASSTPAEFYLPQLLTAFADAHPEVQCHVHVMDSQTVTNCVTERHCDVGFTGHREKPGLLITEPVAIDEVCLAVPSHHPLAGQQEVRPEQILALPFIERSLGSGTRACVAEAMADARIPWEARRIVLEVSSPHALLAAVRAGRGVGLLSRQLCQGASGIHALSITGIPLVRSLYLLYRDEPPRPTIAGFLSFVRGMAPLNQHTDKSIVKS